MRRHYLVLALTVAVMSAVVVAGGGIPPVVERRPATVAGIPTDTPGSFVVTWTTVKALYRAAPDTTTAKVRKR